MITQIIYINHCYIFTYIYTSISIASISFTGRMKFIPRWTPLALSPRKGTENTIDVRYSPLFLECCYFKIASTRCKAIPIASPNKFRIFQCILRLLLFTSFCLVYVQFNKKIRLLKSINRLKKGHNRRKTNKFYCYVSHCDVILHLPKLNMMQLFWQIIKTFFSHCWRKYDAVSVVSDKKS